MQLWLAAALAFGIATVQPLPQAHAQVGPGHYASQSAGAPGRLSIAPGHARAIPIPPAYEVAPASAAQPIDTERAKSAPLRLAPRGALAAPQNGGAEASSSRNAIGTAVTSLAIVLGLFMILVWCSKRFAPAGSAQLPKEAIELLGRAPLSARQQLQMVRIGNKLLVVAVSATDAQTLTEVTDAVEVERIVALCRRGQPASASGSFTQVLSRLSNEPARGGFIGETNARSRGSR